MRLRKLDKKDAPLMFEWMHDNDVVENMQTNFVEKTLKDCEDFIELAQDTRHDYHMAIVDDTDTYMGTVSLKNINDVSAEFGITVRKKAMGKGFSKFAMQKIVDIGFNEMHLEQIYWCVSTKNKRAMAFYDKNGWKKTEVNAIKNFSGKYLPEQIENYEWYLIDKKDAGNLEKVN